MKNEQLRKLKATLLLTLLLTTNPKNAFADNVDDTLDDNLERIVQSVGIPVYADKLKGILANLPSGIKEYMRVRDLGIVLLEDPNGADALYGGNTIRGITIIDNDTGKLTIYVEASTHPGYYERYSTASCNYTEDEFYFIMARDTLLHELGHLFTNDLFSNETGYPLYDELNDIYYEEINNYCETTHYRVDNLGIYANVSIPREYYATAFSCYMSYPEELKDYCPRTFAYLDNYMKNLNELYAPKEESVYTDNSEDLSDSSEPKRKYTYIDNPDPTKPKLLIRNY